jgi:hypothetical protein
MKKEVEELIPEFDKSEAKKGWFPLQSAWQTESG